MSEKKQYGTGKVVLLSALNILLVVIVSCLLMGSFATYRHIYFDNAQDVVASVPLYKVQMKDENGQAVSLPAWLNAHYVQDESISDAKVAEILRDGNFHLFLSEKAALCTQFLAGTETTFPEITPAEVAALLEENDTTIRLHTGLNDASGLRQKIVRNCEVELVQQQQALRKGLSEGISGFCVHALISRWIWYVWGGVLLALLIWIIVIHVKGQRHVGTALKVFSISASIPWFCLLLWGVMGVWIMGWCQMEYYQAAVRLLRGTWLAVGGLGVLSCGALFGIGMIWNLIAEKHAAAPAPEAAAPAEVTMPPAPEAPEIPEEPKVELKKSVRKFCRFCGEPLVNGDAQFCYKCGTAQAEKAPAEEKTEV